jgi:RNA polymerase sigma factor (sigma-70 family)
MITPLLKAEHQNLADDVCQEVFMEAWKYRFMVPAHPRPWLFSRAEERLRQHERVAGREICHAFAVTDEMLERLNVTGLNVTDLNVTDLHIDLSRALGKLRPNDADMVMMHARGFTHREIAEKYGRREDSVRTRVNRALHKVRAHIGTTHADGPLPRSPRTKGDQGAGRQFP